MTQFVRDRFSVTSKNPRANAEGWQRTYGCARHPGTGRRTCPEPECVAEREAAARSNADNGGR